MAIIPAMGSWLGLDVRRLVRNWETNPLGAQQAMLNRGEVVNLLAEQVNHLCAYQQRPVFAHAETTSTVSNANGTYDPFLVWRYDDLVRNARTQSYRVLSLPPIAGGGSTAYAWREGATTNATVKVGSNITNGLTYSNAWIEHRFIWDRGAAPATTEHNGGLSKVNGYCIAAVVVQDEPITNGLTSGTHDHCWPTLRQGFDLLANAVEDVRAKLHTLRKNALPVVLSWSAQSGAGGFAVTAAAPGNGVTGDQRGIRVNRASLVNVLDNSFTARSNASPGISTCAFMAGRGPTDETWGQKVKVQVRAYAQANSANSNAMVQFVGPNSFTNNVANVHVIYSNGLAWFGNANTYIYLNASSADGLRTAERNKIDVFAMSNVQGADLFIYALRGWVEYE